MTTSAASRHTSPWAATMADPPASVDLRAADGADVVVLGAGIVGLTTAVLLQRRGQRVAVLESREPSASVTAHSTVKVTVGQGTVYSRIESGRGRPAAAHYAQANVDGMRRLMALVDELGIECDLRGGQRHLIYTEDPGRAADVEAERALAADLGLPAVPVADPGLPFPVAASFAMEDQATFHPGRYLDGLAAALVEGGGVVVTGVGATGVAERSDSCTVRTGVADVSAGQVVVATGYPILDRGAHFTRLSPTRSYGIAGVLPGGTDPGMTINVGSPTHSTRTVDLDGERLLVVVGEGHEVGHVTDTGERWERLRAWAKDRFGVTTFRYHWSAEEMHSDDHVPFAGLVNPGSRRIFTATGFAGWGMTNGTASAMLIADLASGEDPPSWAAALDARRAEMTLPGRTFLTQNLHVAKTWARDRLCSSRPAAEVAGLGVGDGAVFTVDGNDTAVMRDDDGSLRAVSAVCTHLGCNVAWNSGERSWDCPCHGSRFDVDGAVLHGPASTPLAHRTLDEEPRAVEGADEPTGSPRQ